MGTFLTATERHKLKDFLLDEWSKDPIIDKIHIAGVLLTADALYDLADGMCRLAGCDEALDEIATALARLADLYGGAIDTVAITAEILADAMEQTRQYTAPPETGEPPSIVGGGYFRGAAYTQSPEDDKADEPKLAQRVRERIKALDAAIIRCRSTMTVSDAHHERYERAAAKKTRLEDEEAILRWILKEK